MKSGKSAAFMAAAAAVAAAAVAAIVNLSTVAAAQAQTAAPATTQPAVTPASPMASMLQGMVGLVLVVALIFAVAWLIKKIGPRTRSSGIVQVVGGASVGPREKVVVIRFGQQTMLLGVAPGQVSLLHMAEPGDLADDPAASNAAPRFVDRLRAARSKA